MSFTIITYTMGETVKRHTSASEVETDETVQEIEKSGGRVIAISEPEPESELKSEPFDHYAFNPETATVAEWDAYMAAQEQEDPEQEAYAAAELARGPLAFLPHTMFCVEHDQESTVVSRGPNVNPADPTASYRLACGHLAIDL